MNKKIFLTSLVAIAFACPAMAVDGNATIENGDTCNIDNLGTSENNSTANIEAIWTLQSINCPAGTSFNASTASCDTCASGSWCVAGTYDVENNQTGAGATLCSSLSNGDYPLSASGSSANTACYRNCANADVDHATQVSGAYYYGDNNQCSATECASGWHIKEGFDIRTYANTNPTTSSYGYPWYTDTNGTAHNENSNPRTESYFGFTGAKEWANDLGYATVKGKWACSTVEGTNNNYSWSNPTIFTNLTDETGQTGAMYCYCQMTDARADGSSTWQSAISSWVFTYYNSSADGCAVYCASYCARNVSYYTGFRSALFGSITNYTPSLATCEANNIGLAWYNDTVANNGIQIEPTNSEANQCSYSGTITVPTNTMEKAGYTFGGWKLRTTTTPAQ